MTATMGSPAALTGGTLRPAVGRSGAVPPQLHPREHGAYAILGVPLVAALLVARCQPVACLIAVAAVCGFLAHEPLLLVCGRRGGRHLEFRSQAALRLMWLIAGALVAGGCAYGLGSADVRLGLIISLAAATAGLLPSLWGMQRTLAAQLLALLILTLPAAVVLLAGGLSMTTAWSVWALWVLGRTTTTVAVRSVLASHRSASFHQVPMINDVLQAGATVLCVAAVGCGLTEGLLVWPLVCAAFWLRLRRPATRQIRQMGWGLLAVNVVSGLWMVAWYGL